MPKQQQQQSRRGAVTTRIPQVSTSVPKPRFRQSRAKGAPSSGVVARAAAPVAYSSTERVGAVSVKRMPSGNTVYKRREFIGNIAGSVLFTSTQYRVQPGAFKTFPWLAPRARGYEKYNFRTLKFCYETFTSTATIGTVMFVPDYDSSDAAPTSKVQALEYMDTVRGSAWSPFCMNVSKENLHAQPQYYIAAGVNPINTDVKMYQVANLFVCVEGFSGTATVGELWVEYEVELIAPDASLAPFDDAKIVGNSGITSAAPFGTAPIVTGSADITVGTTTILFNSPYEGILTAHVTASAIASMNAPTVSSTASKVSFTVSTDDAGAASGSEQYMFRVFVSMIAGDTLTLDLTPETSVSAITLDLSAFRYADH